MDIHPDQTTHDLAHLAFCALVALQTAVQDSSVASPMAEHLFIVRWLATAQMQKRFPKTVAMDIQLLLDKGRKQGIGAKLKSHLEYVWRSCSGEIRQQSDLFRLTYTVESLKTLGWRNELVTPAEWDSVALDEAAGPALYVVKAALQSAFTTEGQLITPLEFKIAGGTQIVVDALCVNGLTADCLGNVVALRP
ncbi:DUF2913 family protein [Serratia fonticola]|uniref:DUF2913 family protein n=1 Tax=Serratia fonticola TaxID=47917 RepID=UPI0015C62998|nr:DUF2913 family protein [Serratia fonticola]MBC3380438.1 DUF2913 family protein [Serratia fonticola]NYA39637.1 DUF2913 family protein [Serratia fonticola]